MTKCDFSLRHVNFFAFTHPNFEVLESVVYNLNVKHGFNVHQGGRTWQAFVGGKSGHENFRQTRICNFRNKCVVLARNRKFANLTQ